MHLILTGATGLVGSAVLHHVLSLSPATASAQNITRLTVLSRRPNIPLLSHPARPQDNTFTKVEVVEHQDYSSYPAELLSKLRSAPASGTAEDSKIGIIWALGISQREVNSDAEYIAITKTYAVEAAKAFSSLLQPQTKPDKDDEGRSDSVSPVNFIYVSGEGASHSPKWYHPIFSRVKGETETELLQLSRTEPYAGKLKVYNVRPAGVDGVNQPAVWDEALKKDLRNAFAYKAMMSGFLPLLRSGVLKSQHSPTEELGRVMVDLACGDGGALQGEGVEGWEGRVVRNTGIRRLYREAMA